MTPKSIVNSLVLAIMLSIIPMPAHAGLFDSISNYFNQPTKNSLVATTAIAGTFLLASCVCAWNWWKKSSNLREEVAHTKTARNKLLAEKKVAEDRSKEQKMKNWKIKSQLALARTEIRALTEYAQHQKPLLAERTKFKRRLDLVQAEVKALEENAQQRNLLPTEPTLHAWDIAHLNNIAH